MKKLILLSILLIVGCDEGDSVVYSDPDINLPIAHPQCKVEYKYYTTTDEIVDTYILCYDNISEAMCLYYATEGCQDEYYINNVGVLGYVSVVPRTHGAGRKI